MLSFLYAKRSRMIGLDIQPDEIYLLEITQSKSGHQIENFVSTPLPNGVIVDGKILQSDQLISAIETVVQQTKTQGCMAAIALPGHCVINKKIALAHCASEEEYEMEIHAHLDKYFPGMTQDVSFDFLLQEMDRVTQNILLVAAKNEVVSSYLSAVNQAGLMVKIIDVDWYALTRAIALYSECESKNIAIIDVSEQSMRVIFLQNTHMIFSQQFSIDTQDFLPQLFMQVQQAIQACFAAYRPFDIEQFYLIGKSTSLREIHNYFSSQSEIKIEIPDSLFNINVASNINKQELTDKIIRSLVSVGLAVRSRPLW